MRSPVQLNGRVACAQVIDPVKGVLFEHQETVWGDNACATKMSQIQEAINQIGA